MKKLGKAILGLALALSMCFSMFIPVYAEGETVDTLVGSLIGYYRDGARTDVLRTLDTLKEVSKDDYDQWQFIVTSTYDTEYSRDVTGLAKIIGFDANKVGKQNVVVVYTETLHHSTSSSEDVTMTAEFEVEVKTAPITVPVNPQPTPDKPVNAVNTGDNSPLAIMTMVAGLAAAGMFLAKRKEN